MDYAIRLTPAAARQFAQLDRWIQRRIAPAIDALSTDPRPPGAKKLVGPTSLWRIRVGDYRVISQIRDRELVVVVVAIGHRGEIYR